MADTSALWTGAAISAFGVVLGFALSSTSGLIRTQYERRGHWLSLRTDVVRCGLGAKGYLEGGVAVPAGRLPIGSYTTSLPALLKAELLSESEIEAVSRFFDNAGNFNRSLDYAQTALGNEAKNLAREVSRAKLKARKLAPGQASQRTQYDEALGIVDTHIRQRTGYWLLWWK